MTIDLNSGKVARWLVLMISCLVMAHVLVQILAYLAVDADFYGIEQFFDLDDEANVPTLYESLAMLLAASILAAIAHFETPTSGRRRYWSALAVIFVVLAIDETACLHEIISSVVDDFVETSDYLSYSWVIPYAVFLSVVFFLYARFLLGLPPRVRRLIVLSGVTFALGALGFEAISAHHSEVIGHDEYDLISTLLAIIEETLEMVGVAIFIYALLLYAESENGGFEITIGHSGH